ALRLLLSGGAGISPDLIRRVRATFRAEYAQTYGLTETSPYLTISRLTAGERGLPEDEACRLLSRAGRPMPGVTVRVSDPAGNAVPADVERALDGLRGVRELAVVGTPDAHWGHVVTAVVVPEGEGTSLEAVRAHARGRLPDFMVPRRLVLLDALPRTPSGKVSKRE